MNSIQSDSANAAVAESAPVPSQGIGRQGQRSADRSDVATTNDAIVPSRSIAPTLADAIGTLTPILAQVSSVPERSGGATRAENNRGGADISANHPLSIEARPNESEAQLHSRALSAMARTAGLSPAASGEFSRRATALDGGKLHGASSSSASDGPELSAGDYARAKASGTLRFAPTVAQAGLLHFMQADSANVPSGAAVGFALPSSAAPWTPANTAVTPNVAADILKNVGEGKPPFKPELGRVGGVTWLVTKGNPYTGTGGEKSVTLPVEVTNRTGKPAVTFNEKQLLERYEQQLPKAKRTVEQQYRSRTGLPESQPLSKSAQRSIAREASKLAERQMWTSVGDSVRNSPSGVGTVELKDSVFSRSGDGEFTLTSKASNIRIKGGAKALVDIIERDGVKAEPGVLDAAKSMAGKEGWGGTVRGAFRVGGRVLIVVGVAADAYKIYTAKDKVKATAEVAGGWAGAVSAGAAFDVATAPIDFAGPIGWAAQGVGTLVAGGIGYYAGSHAAKAIYELTVEGKPLEIGGSK